MTGRNRNQVTKLETTIEQCRGEGKWQWVFELADKLKSGYTTDRHIALRIMIRKSCVCRWYYPQVESLANFLMGEGKLESYLEEYPPIEDNILKARHGLTDVKRYLNSVIGESVKKVGIALDAHLLLSKLFFACGQYEESLQSFVLAELITLSEK